MASSSTLNIRAAHPASCSICGHAHLIHAGDKEFGVSGCDHFEGRRIFVDHGVPIAYYECRQCGFIFTNAVNLSTSPPSTTDKFGSQDMNRTTGRSRKTS